ncbi:MAG: cell division protein FtsX [Bacteroidetes bacterium HGW-Bacteroidetes-7]|jgi:cell division transport system permease protein|nr:MAG: cell division protein FtsX [Bacteroidetes bacterium HGW-Bacteroidetes-7]
MKKRERNIIYRRLIQSYLSSVISISMVLILVGLSGLMAVNARSVSDFFRENIKLSLLFNENTTESYAMEVMSLLEKEEYLKEARFISKEQGTAEMSEILGADFLSIFETNPIPVSIDLFLKARYLEPDSLRSVEAKLAQIEGVEEVVYQESLVKTINENMEKAGYVVGVFILLLLFISFVLINNTVRLNLYAKRFIIHTMKLVGARRSFIRRPLLVKAFIQGLISGLLSVSILSAGVYLVYKDLPELFNILDFNMVAAVFVGVVLLGILLCLFSTFIIVSRLVSMSGDDIYY